MPLLNRTWLWRFTMLAGLLGVALGAFGAHALADRLSPAMLDTWRTAVSWHMLHVLAAMGVLLAGRPGTRRLLQAACCWLLGIAIFSGSLYLLVLTGITGLGAITPVGGLILMAGWAVAAMAPLEEPTD